MSVQSHIEELQRRHAALKRELEEALQHPSVDDSLIADLKRKKLLLKESNASIRRICVNLDRVREFVLTKGMKSVGRADWGKSGFFTGHAPAPRRISA